MIVPGLDVSVTDGVCTPPPPVVTVTVAVLVAFPFCPEQTIVYAVVPVGLTI